MLAMAIVLFVGRFTQMPIKIPMIIWGGAALFILISDINTAIQLWSAKYAAAGIGSFYFFIGLLTAAAALFAILYAFKAIKKIPAAVILGILLGALVIIGVAFNIKNLAGYLSVNNKNGLLITSMLFNILYSLVFPVGIFLTILSAKEKQAAPIIDEPAGK